MGSSFAPCQSSITAYARHGRHCSDRRSSSRAVQPPAMRCRIKSPLGNASGSPNALIAMYCAVHGPIPGSACSAAVTFSALRRRGERHRPGAHGARKRPNRLSPRGNHAHFLDRRGGQLLCGGEDAIEPISGLDRAAEALCQSAGNRGCGRHRYLLAEDGADRQFKAVPRARSANARMPFAGLGRATGRHRTARRSRPGRRQGRTCGGRVRQSPAGLASRETGLRVRPPALMPTVRPESFPSCRRWQWSADNRNPSTDSTPGVALADRNANQRIPIERRTICEAQPVPTPSSPARSTVFFATPLGYGNRCAESGRSIGAGCQSRQRTPPAQPAIRFRREASWQSERAASARLPGDLRRHAAGTNDANDGR